MNNKIFEAWISSVCGVFGWGIVWTNINWGDVIPKIMISTASAFLAGGIGYLGKLGMVWLLRKIKAFHQQLKNRKP